MSGQAQLTVNKQYSTNTTHNLFQIKLLLSRNNGSSSIHVSYYCTTDDVLKYLQKIGYSHYHFYNYCAHVGKS